MVISAPDVTKLEKEIAGERKMTVHKYPSIHMEKPKRQRKGVLLLSEPLYLLVFSRVSDETEYLVELTQRQMAKLLEEDGIRIISLQASIDKDGNWRKKEVWL